MNMKSTSNKTPGTEQTANQAFRISAILFGGNVAATLFALFLAWQLSAWQLYVIAGVLALVDVFSFAAMRMIRNGRQETGGWILIATTLVSILTGPSLISGTGVIVGVTAVVMTYIIASQTLKGNQVRRAWTVSLVIGVLVVATDFLHLEYRMQVPAIQTFVPVITVAVLLLAGFFGLRGIAASLRSDFWQNLSLARKLLISFSALGLLALVVGVVAYTGLNRVKNSYDHALSEGEGIKDTSLQLTIDLLTARRNEKDFLARWTTEGFDTAYANYVVPNQHAVDDMKQKVAVLRTFAPVVGQNLSATYPQAQYESDLVILSNSIDSYEQNFQMTVQLIKEKGFEDSGLEGQFRTNVHNIEDLIIGREGLDPLTITMLTIRRHEKDYILRGDQTYIDQLHQSVTDLKSQIALSDQLGPTDKRVLRGYADLYRANFDAMVKKNVAIDAATQAFGEAAHTMEPIVAKLTDTGAQLSQFNATTAQTNSTQTLLYSSITLVAALLVAFFLSVALSRQITQPVRSLTATANEIAAGKFDVQAEVTSGDEIGTLAQTFNIMTERLGQAFEDVRRRAAELATVAEVSIATSTILETKRLLQEVVDLTKERFNLYHSHIYLMDEKAENLILTAGAGEPGRIMVSEGRSIPLSWEQSLVARAARERKGVTVNDVTQATDFLPNPLLPDTHSELAVPMIVGGNVIGVFDIQSEQVGRFTESDVNIQTALAAQVATSIQNVRSFERAKTQADLETLVNSIGQKIQRSITVEDTLQTAVREIGLALGAVRVRANLMAHQSEKELNQTN